MKLAIQMKKLSKENERNYFEKFLKIVLEDVSKKAKQGLYKTEFSTDEWNENIASAFEKLSEHFLKEGFSVELHQIPISNNKELLLCWE
jgi:lipoate-protein ligase A